MCAAGDRQKYSIEKNLPNESQLPDLQKLSPFRMNKINLVWQKVRLNFPDAEKLEALYVSLKEHDLKELAYKHSKMQGVGDEDGEDAAKLRQDFSAILQEFGLKDKYLPELKPKQYDRPAKSPTTDQFNEILPDKNTEFNNPKLDTLWKSAAQSGFSESELETLKVELNHHQEKVDELNVLLDDVDVRLLSNKILQEAPMRASDFGEEPKNKEVNNLKEALNKNLDRLQTKVKGNVTSFTENRVINLWSRALKGNFTENELASLKEELSHFQKKIEKHNWIRGQVEMIEADHQQGKTFEADHHKEMKRRDTEMYRKIKKLGSHLEEWVGSRDESEL